MCRQMKENSKIQRNISGKVVPNTTRHLTVAQTKKEHQTKKQMEETMIILIVTK